MINGDLAVVGESREGSGRSSALPGGDLLQAEARLECCIARGADKQLDDAFLTGLISASIDGLSRANSARVGIEAAGKSFEVVRASARSSQSEEFYGTLIP